MRATDFYSEEEYEAVLNDRVATDAEAMQEMAYNMGGNYADMAWMLDHRDVWVRNPHYTGPDVRHPEDDYED